MWTVLSQMQNSYSVVRISSQMECSGSQLVGMIVFVRNPKHCSLTPSHPCPTPSSLKLSGDVLQCYAGGEIFHTLQHRLRSVNRFKPFFSRWQQKVTTPRSHSSTGAMQSSIVWLKVYEIFLNRGHRVISCLGGSQRTWINQMIHLSEQLSVAHKLSTVSKHKHNIKTNTYLS